LTKISRVRIVAVREIQLSADELVSKLLAISERETVCILDSCGVSHLGSHLLIAGVRPVEVLEISNDDALQTLCTLESKLSHELAAVMTLSYDFGSKLQLRSDVAYQSEPDVFLSLFDSLIIHDYDTGKTFSIGKEASFSKIEALLAEQRKYGAAPSEFSNAAARSNFTRSEYLRAVDRIQEHIRRGDTYQTNLTQSIRCELPAELKPQAVFQRLRRDHPAPFSAFMTRQGSTVVSASPERFFRIGRDGVISTSPIKGTRRRGATAEEDTRLRAELESSEKDRAENIMIVDLMRNDLGRVCEYGTVEVEKLCDVEEHPTLFHLVSTVSGKLRDKTSLSDVLKALFPCGSITGAPKIRTMELIDEIEPTSRGLSMGAIGSYIPPVWEIGNTSIDSVFDFSVAIRTIVVRENEAVFSVGGGVVIDSDPEKEFDESLLKAKALLDALGAELS
jgi:para-aminobenzoate synthetase component 1